MKGKTVNELEKWNKLIDNDVFEEEYIAGVVGSNIILGTGANWNLSGC